MAGILVGRARARQPAREGGHAMGHARRVAGRIRTARDAPGRLAEALLAAAAAGCGGSGLPSPNQRASLRTSRTRVISDGAPKRFGGPQYPVPRLV
jgi:hypothetical protein